MTDILNNELAITVKPLPTCLLRKKYLQYSQILPILHGPNLNLQCTISISNFSEVSAKQVRRQNFATALLLTTGYWVFFPKILQLNSQVYTEHGINIWILVIIWFKALTSWYVSKDPHQLETDFCFFIKGYPKKDPYKSTVPLSAPPAYESRQC